MPTEVIHTVAPAGGGDYVSLSAWEAAQQRDLVTADEVAIAEVEGGGDSGSVTLSGWTTDATRYPHIRPASGHEHDGVWDTDKAKIDVSGGRVIISVANAIVQGIQIRNTATSASQTNITCNSAEGDGSNTVIRDLILRGPDATPGASSANLLIQGSCTVVNCVGYGFRHGVLMQGLTTGDNIKCYNLTLIATERAFRIADADGTKTAKNIYASGDTQAYLITGSVTTSRIATNDTSGPEAGRHNTAHNTTNFTNVTGGSEDYHLPDGSALIDDGVDVSSENTGITTDYEDGDRTAAAAGAFWDIGADENGVARGDGAVTRRIVRAPVSLARRTRHIGVFN